VLDRRDNQLHHEDETRIDFFDPQDAGRLCGHWKHKSIYLIPMTQAGYAGTASAMRPITLLETLSKLLMKTLLRRMNKVLLAHPILKGAKYSGLPGTDTTTPIALLHAACAQANIRTDQVWVYFEDKSKAFDSVPHDLLRRALERIRLPPAFVECYFGGCLTGRTALVLTSFGPSQRFAIKRGIPQGAVESLLMLNILYDVHLAAIAKVAVRNGFPTVASPLLSHKAPMLFVALSFTPMLALGARMARGRIRSAVWRQPG
jgi:hypothetical protein